MFTTMIVDEPDHHFDWRSSSAIAKYALALSRISLAWRSSRFSRSSAFILSAMSVGRAIVVLEAPGGHERPVIRALTKAGRSLACVKLGGVHIIRPMRAF
jgi:hypothetical protein